MSPIVWFVTQFVWFTLAWTAITVLVLWPWSKRLEPNDRLALWIAPQMFRVLGLGLLVDNLSPGMPPTFAVPTAIADTTTAILALAAFIALRNHHPSARGLTWACTAVGITDLLIAFPHAATTGAIPHLATQWYVPVFAGPIMITSHATTLTTLLKTRPT